MIFDVRDKRVSVRNGSQNVSTWSNLLKYNLSDTIKKWYLFPDLGVVCTTTNTKSIHHRFDFGSYVVVEVNGKVIGIIIMFLLF